jgi:hypothetical protein
MASPMPAVGERHRSSKTGRSADRGESARRLLYGPNASDRDASHLQPVVDGRLLCSGCRPSLPEAVLTLPGTQQSFSLTTLARPIDC